MHSAFWFVRAKSAGFLPSVQTRVDVVLGITHDVLVFKFIYLTVLRNFNIKSFIFKETIRWLEAKMEI